VDLIRLIETLTCDYELHTEAHVNATVPYRIGSHLLAQMTQLFDI